MRQSILVIAVVCLSIFSSNTLAQTPDRIENARKSYQQGLELSENGQLVQAAEVFRRAVQFDPEYADAYAALGRTYFKLREWQKAKENLNRATSLKAKQRETIKVNSPPATLKQNTAAITEVNRPSAPIPVPKEAVTQSIDGPPPPSSPPQNGSIQPSMSSDPPPLKALEEAAEAKTVAGPTPVAANNSALPEQTPVAAPVAMSVTPAPNVKETGPAVSSIPPTEELPLTKIYRVGPNDVLDIRLNDSGQQSTLFTVTATGLLEHPLLNEPMSVAGLTVEEIDTRIEADLRKRAIIEDPKAVVGVRDYASHAVLISGLVRDAGTKFLRREAIPLYVVVADAQPLPEAAKVTVVRNESNQIYEIDLNQAADMNFLVRAGDVISLSPNTTQFVYIGGEIKFPGEKTFRRGLTLMQVILSAGGVGKKAKIAEIARDDGKGFLVPTRFKLNEIVSGKAMDPILKPGDRISILR